MGLVLQSISARNKKIKDLVSLLLFMCWYIIRFCLIFGGQIFLKKKCKLAHKYARSNLT